MALATAKKALELSGGHAWVRAEIAMMLALRGDTADATEVYEALRRLPPTEQTILTAGAAAALLSDLTRRFPCSATESTPRSQSW